MPKPGRLLNMSVDIRDVPTMMNRRQMLTERICAMQDQIQSAGRIKKFLA
jgi:hypothetical protein